MQYQTGQNSPFTFITKEMEITLSLGIILWVAYSEAFIRWQFGLIIFLAFFIYKANKTYKELQLINSRALTITDDELCLTSSEGEERYKLSEFKIMLYKRGVKKVKVMVLMSEDKGFKLEHFKDMQAIYDLLKDKLPMRKKIPWWQRL